MAVDPAVLAALSALGGAVVGTMGGVLTQHLASRSENERLAQRFRQERHLKDDDVTRGVLNEALAAAYETLDAIDADARAKASAHVSAASAGNDRERLLGAVDDAVAATQAALRVGPSIQAMALVRARLAVCVGPRDVLTNAFIDVEKAVVALISDGPLMVEALVSRDPAEALLPDAYYERRNDVHRAALAFAEHAHGWASRPVA